MSRAGNKPRDEEWRPPPGGPPHANHMVATTTSTPDPIKDQAAALDFNSARAGHGGRELRLPADVLLAHAATLRGFRLATQCTRCGRWLVAPRSVAAHLGPVCRAKLEAAAA